MRLNLSISSAIMFFLLNAACKSLIPNNSDLDASDSAPSSTYIKSMATGKVLDVQKHGLSEGDQIQLWSYSKQTNQEWQFKSHENNIYSLVSVRSNLCLEVLNFSQDDEAPIGQKKCNGERNQKWEMIRVPEGYIIKNTWNYKCLSLLKKGVSDGTLVVNDQCKNEPHQFWAVAKDFNFNQPQTKIPPQPKPETAKPPQNTGQQRIQFNPIIGIHAVKPAYHFTSDDPAVETVKASFNLGFRMVKVDDRDRPALSAALNLPFSHVFLWFRTTRHWINGVTSQFEQTEYQETYKFAKTLLDNKTLAGRHIYIGHWEGDWLLLGEGKADGDASDKAIEGMIAWLKIRQKAILDAKRDSPESKVNIYHYVEVNRVRDAMVGGKKRLVNEVLPHIDIDYVSYSGYDVQQDTEKNIHATLDYIQKNMRPHSSIQGKRVFIGEFGMSLRGVDREGQSSRNKEFIKKFLSWGTPFLIYWSMYDTTANLVPDRKLALIDDKNQKTPFCLALESFFKKQHDFVKSSGKSGSINFNEMMQFTRSQF